MDDVKKNPVKSYRRAAKMTLRALAKEWDTSFATLCRIESGTQLIPEKLLPVVELATGIPAKELRPDLVQRSEKLSVILGEGAQ